MRDQTSTVFRHLREEGSITPLEALERYGIMRLGARIHDLREDGIPIKTTRRKGRNRYGRAVSYAEYSIDQEVIHGTNS